MLYIFPETCPNESFHHPYIQNMYNNNHHYFMQMENNQETCWSREEDKVFEQGLVKFSDENNHERWQRIAEYLPGKTVDQIKAHYDILLYDIGEIESGRVELPYSDDSWVDHVPSQISFGSGRGRGSDAERKKGTPWTEDEHRLFLIGLEKYGKGDWRSISRNVVVSRTPTQVASHAQKYFLRHNSGKKERKRSSIHDITTTTDITMPAPTNLPGQGGFQDFGFSNA